MTEKRKNFVSRFALLVAEFFYCGRFPFAPGTAGSLGSLIIWVPSLYLAWPLWLNLILLVFLFVIGVWSSEYGIKYYKKIDPKQVVIDEVVGQGLPFLVISPNLFEVIAAFAVFRFFDIYKPWPIKNIEKKFPDKWGIMLDDVAAGIFAMIFMLLTKYVLVTFS